MEEKTETEVEVLREQLDYLIEHRHAGLCDCKDCERFSMARAALLEPFSIVIYMGAAAARAKARKKD